MDFRIPIRADDQQTTFRTLGKKLFEKIEGGSVGPMEIVEEQDQRMRRGGEHGNETFERQVGPRLGFLRRESRQFELRPDDAAQLRA